MSDLIYRDTAIDIVMEMPTFEDPNKEKFIHQNFTAVKLMFVPGVDMISPKSYGRWIKGNKDIPFFCSRCGRPFDHEWNFCPDCGADMRVLENK